MFLMVTVNVIFCKIFSMDNLQKNILIFGANGAIGHSLSVLYANAGPSVFAVTRGSRVFENPNINNIAVNYDDEQAFEGEMDSLFSENVPDIVVVACGALCIGEKMPEKSVVDIDAQYMEDLYRVNTILPTMIMKRVVSRMPRDKDFKFAALSARVGSISDNRLGGWYGYRASKAALNMIIKTASIEVGRKHKNSVIIGLHPGTVDSDLSKPFQNNVPDDKLFSSDQSAQYLFEVIENLTPADSGKVFDWKGDIIEP